MIRRAALGLLLLLAGCAGTPFRWQDVDRVHDGVTEPQVVAILGPPDSRSQHGNRLALG